MKFEDRYSVAVRSSNLKSEPDSLKSDSDVIGAAGLAAKKRPLAIALLRLFSGDNHAAADIVRMMAKMVQSKAWEWDSVTLADVECEDIGRMVLAWHRDGVCKACSGHGFQLIDGAPSLSGNACPTCRGSRKVPFEAQFAMERLHLALWLRERIEREQGMAGQAAMQALAPRLDF